MWDKYPERELTEAEARLRHPDCEVIAVFDILHDGERRPAIFVWRRVKDADKEGPEAIYWRKKE